VERSHEAIALGQKLATFSPHPALQSAQWLHQSVTDPFPAADAAVLSYVLNEVEPSLRSALIAGCWERVSLLVLVEPGTPQGFEIIRKAREQLIALRAHLIAPCPHALACPMQRPDWCHFAARVERTRLHRYLKEGTLGYEDEKFSYLVAAKMAGPSITGRLVRPPLKQSGHVRVTVCSNRGQIEEKVITRKDKAAYRNARKAEWGDSL
jgi:ribosomal protein RSM22 (predicted rRNA methylase)